MNAAIRTDVPPRELGTILLVEDEVLIRFDFAEQLRDEGFTVIEASNGDEALTVLKTPNAVAFGHY